MKKRLLVGLLAALSVLIAVVVVRTLTFTAPPQPTVAAPSVLAFDGDAAATRLAKAITFPTISGGDSATRDAAATAFTDLHRHLRASFPKVYVTLHHEVVSGHSLLFTWSGSQPDLPPIVLIAHQDVVPIEDPSAWTRPPFGGVIADGHIWGRGAMDFKLGVLGILEAVEALLLAEFTPRRTVIIGLGHDEEIGGQQGAKALAAALRARQVKPWLVLDEGLMVTDGIIDGLDRPAALIGIAEKGFLTLELAVSSTGGHASTPPDQTAVGIVAAAVARLQDAPFPSTLSEPIHAMMDRLGPHMPFGNKLAMANRWLLGGLVAGKMAGKPATAAAVRTTIAPTMLTGSKKPNVLAKRATAIVNFRLAPGDTRKRVIARVREVIDDDRVSLKAVDNFLSDPSPSSPVNGAPYATLETTIRQIYPQALVAPALFVGASDGRHYQGLTSAVYRFSPQTLTPSDRLRFHGIDERVSIDGYRNAIRFYAQLIRNASL